MSSSRRRHIRRARAHGDVKDRLIQARVPEHLEHVLKEEAKKRRLSVSHLIRNMLEDTLHIVDTVVSGAEELLDTSAGIAEQVARDAGRIASNAREVVSPVTGAVRKGNAVADDRDDETDPGARAAGAWASAPEVDDEDFDPDDLPDSEVDRVVAWNPVVANRRAQCASCGITIEKGTAAHMGYGEDLSHPPVWLCNACLKEL